MIIVRSRGFIYGDDNAPTESCHASTILDTGSCLLAAWFGGSYEGHADVGVWLSRNVHGEWQAPREVAHPVAGAPCWNPVLTSDGERAMLYWKVGPSPQEWWGRCAVSEDQGITWSEPRAPPDGYLGPVKNKSLRRQDGTWLHPSSTEHDGWRCHFELGQDSISSLPDPEGLSAIQPTLLHEQTRLIALTRTRAGCVGYSESTDTGRSWSPLARTDLPNPNSGIDAVTLTSGRHLLVYNPVPRGRFPLSIAVSSDARRWERIVDLETERGEFSYPAVVQGKGGEIHVTYTHHRRRIAHVVLAENVE